MSIIKKLASGLALIVLFVSFDLLLAQKLFAQSIPHTDNPQSLVGGGLQPTGAGLQNTGQVLAADSVYNYDSSGQNIKLDIQQAAQQPQNSNPSTSKQGFPWRYFLIGGGVLVGLMLLAKILEIRRNSNIFTA